eukprot:g1563.t1
MSASPPDPPAGVAFAVEPATIAGPAASASTAIAADSNTAAGPLAAAEAAPAAMEEPRSVSGLMAGMAKLGGGGVIKETISTFSNADGKVLKGDIMLSGMSASLTALKEMVADDAAKKPQHAPKWSFRTSPHEAFGKSLDDTFRAFLVWAATNDANDGASEVKHGDTADGGGCDHDAALAGAPVINVSKAFRRLKAYAEWMESVGGNDLIEPPLTAASVATGMDAWKFMFTYDAQERLVWWLDLGASDDAKLGTMTVADHIRTAVWAMHFIQYDARAQRNGVVIVEDVANMGFWKMMTIVPMRVGVKLDKLTIGCSAVKMKAIICLDTPWWCNAFMKLMMRFLSKKMQGRIKLMQDRWQDVSTELGGTEFVLKGFGHCGGSCPALPLEGIIVHYPGRAAREISRNAYLLPPLLGIDDMAAGIVTTAAQKAKEAIIHY